jgi:hypothetical protein
MLLREVICGVSIVNAQAVSRVPSLANTYELVPRLKTDKSTRSGEER